MITIATFPSPEEAHMFRGFLGSREIEAFVLDENICQIYWLYTNAVGGVRVQVNDEDEEAAGALYHEYMESLRSGPYPVAPVRAWPLVVLATFLVGVPLMLFGRRKP
jgi:hypothetical protein